MEMDMVEIKKPISKLKAEVKDLVNAFKDTLVTYTDKVEYKIKKCRGKEF